MILEVAPQPPDPTWMRDFARCIVTLRPGSTRHFGLQQALLAHSSTWLLDASEAASMWNSALLNIAQHRTSH